MTRGPDMLRERLRDEPLPGETEAAARSWPVVEAALAERAPALGERAPAHGDRAYRVRRAPVVPRLLVAAALGALALLALLTPAGAWIKDRLEPDSRPANPGFAALPKGGQVLALSRSGAYAIDSEGGFQRLGSFSEAGWSPRGRHVIGVDGRRLVAVDPRGTIKWSLARSGRVHHPAWSTGLGFAVAYLEGATLRVIAGDGDPATHRLVRRGAASVTPAWRPRSDRVLTYATRAGALETLDVVTLETIWRARAPGAARGALAPARALAWSRDGRRLAVLSSRAVGVLGRSGRPLATLPLPGAARDLALHPSGRRAAVVVAGRGRARVLELELTRGGRQRQLFQGDVDGIAWSADGRHLLVGSRGADQWLLLGRNGRVTALDGVSRELGSAGGFPRVVDWCCGQARG